MAKTIQSEVEDLKDQLDTLSKKLEMVGASGETEALDQLKQLKTYFSDLSESVRDKWETGSEKVKEVGSNVQGYVEENPWQVAGLAAAVGFLAAMLICKDRK